MSKDWTDDMAVMHRKYGVNDWMEKNKNDRDKVLKFLEFRLEFLKEELEETVDACKNHDPEEIVDGLIDLCVIAIGTLNAFDVDPHKAWDEILKCNMNKEVGIKPGRPNPLGLPDLIKPKDWQGPSHDGNHGLFPNAF
tara:strand:+ start:1724 stop:2137 length:414 start_codon:yes stop_codon:yes gene_type:complete